MTDNDYEDYKYDAEPAVAGAADPAVEPEKKDKDDIDDDDQNARRTNGARVLGIALIIFGIASALIVLPVFQEWDNYSNIKDPLDEGGSPFAFQLNLPIALPICGAVMIVAGGLSLGSYFKNKRALGYVAMVLALAAVAIQIYACVTIRTTLEGLRKKLEGNPITSEFDDAEKSIMDFTSAIFNTCCLPLYDSRNYTVGNIGQLRRTNGQGEEEDVDDNQRPVGLCKDSVDETCPIEGENRMFPDIINKLQGVAGNLFDVLCQCISDEDQYNKFITILERDGLCEKYRKIIVPDADSREVPTTSLTFETLMVAVKSFRPEYSKFVPIGEFALVGKILPGPTVYNEPAEDIGYSCGIGYAKADAYYMYLYLDDHVKVTVIGGIVIASLAAVANILVLLFWLSGGGNSDQEVLEYGYNEYDAPEARPVKDIDV